MVYLSMFSLIRVNTSFRLVLEDKMTLPVLNQSERSICISPRQLLYSGDNRSVKYSQISRVNSKSAVSIVLDRFSEERSGS